MRRVKALFCLVLFLFSTAGANASVHLCGGEVTDIAILSAASCDHEEVEEVAVECKHHCCEDEESHNDELPESSDDCCDTEELSDVETFLTVEEKSALILAVQLIPSFYDFYFENHKVLNKNVGLAYEPPIVSRDVNIEIQCFRI